MNVIPPQYTINYSMPIYIQVSLFCAARGEYNLLIYYVGEVPFYFNLDLAGLRVDVIFFSFNN